MKICGADRCNYSVISNGDGRSHQYLRPEKSVPTLRKSPVRPVWKYTGMKTVFEAIRNTRPHKLRLVYENVALITIDEHFLYDQGTELERKRYAEENHCNWDIP